MAKLIISILISLLLAVSFPTSAEGTRFLVLSDIHLNPFDLEQKYPDDLADPKNDTNYFYFQNLMKSIVAKEAAHPPQFIIITGDLLTHAFQQKYNKYRRTGTSAHPPCGVDIRSCELQTMNRLIMIIRNGGGEAYRDLPIYLALGNNDSDGGNYFINTSFLKEMGAHIFSYINPNVNKVLQAPGLAESEFVKNFVQNAGAYVATFNGGPKMMFLNTVLYANKAEHDRPLLRCNESCDNLRKAQNAFITRELDLQKPNLIIAHIPPFEADKGYDLQLSPQLLKSPFKNPNSYTLAGHWHFYAPFSKSNEAHGKILSSITYRNGAIPGYSVFEYEDTKGDGNGIVRELEHYDLLDASSRLSGKSSVDFYWTKR